MMFTSQVPQPAAAAADPEDPWQLYLRQGEADAAAEAAAEARRAAKRARPSLPPGGPPERAEVRVTYLCMHAYLHACIQTVMPALWHESKHTLPW